MTYSTLEIDAMIKRLLLYKFTIIAGMMQQMRDEVDKTNRNT